MITASPWCSPARVTSGIEAGSFVDLGCVGDDPFHRLAFAGKPVHAAFVPFVVPDDDMPSRPLLVRQRHHDWRFRWICHRSPVSNRYATRAIDALPLNFDHRPATGARLGPVQSGITAS